MNWSTKAWSEDGKIFTPSRKVAKSIESKLFASFAPWREIFFLFRPDSKAILPPRSKDAKRGSFATWLLGGGAARGEGRGKPSPVLLAWRA
jgi:hypothetical protein